MSKDNGNEPAYPESVAADQGGVDRSRHAGLTKRELFAKDIYCAMIGAIKNSEDADAILKNGSQVACIHADLLLAELGKAATK